MNCLISHKTDPLKSLLDVCDVQTHMVKNQYFMLQSCIFYGKKKKNACMLCSFSSTLLFIGDKIADYCFKNKITPSPKANDQLKFSQYVALKIIK